MSNVAQIKKPKRSQGADELLSVGYSEQTSDRILAYLASMGLLAGIVGSDDAYIRGRVLVERLALSARGTGNPTLRLSAAQCADVLRFLVLSYPREPRTWWLDSKDAPSHVTGFMFVLDAMAESLRAGST